MNATSDSDKPLIREKDPSLLSISAETGVGGAAGDGPVGCQLWRLEATGEPRETSLRKSPSSLDIG